jgi:hypothetical protein
MWLAMGDKIIAISEYIEETMEQEIEGKLLLYTF